MAISVLTGLAALWLLTNGAGPWGPAGIIQAILIGALYTFCIWGANVAASNIAEHYRPMRNRTDVVLHVIVMAMATLLSFLLATPLVALLFGVRFAGSALAIVGIIAFTASLIVNGIVRGIQFYDRMREAERAAIEAELRALRAQINPHFLFNALNTIANLIPTRPGEAEKATEDLADLFRYSLRASQHPTVSMADELESVMIYLSVERARFGERLQVELDIPDGLRDARVPSLVLQPLVENAVKHGAGQTIGPCTITVSAIRSGDTLEILVADTGPGFSSQDAAVVLPRGTGLANIQHRLKLQAGKHGGLDIQPNGVRIWMPFEDASAVPSSNIQHSNQPS